MTPPPTDPVPTWIKWTFRAGAVTVVFSILYVLVSATGVMNPPRSPWVSVAIDDLAAGEWKRVSVAGEDHVVLRLSDAQAGAVSRLAAANGEPADHRLSLVPVGQGTAFANFSVWPAQAAPGCQLEPAVTTDDLAIRWTDSCDGAPFDLTGRSLTGAREDLPLPDRRVRGSALQVRTPASRALVNGR